MGLVAAELAVAEQVGPDEARRLARLILEHDRFQDARVPRPFQGAIRRLGELLEGPGRVVRSWYDALVDFLPGAEATFWVLVATIVVALATIASLRLARRQARRAGLRATRPMAPPMDPSDLENAAVDAEARGDLSSAVRLRFRAGLLRLHSAGVIDLTPSVTNGRLTNMIASPTFASITRIFDEIAYGMRPARAEDLSFTKRGWPRALEEASRP